MEAGGKRESSFMVTGKAHMEVGVCLDGVCLDQQPETSLTEIRK